MMFFHPAHYILALASGAVRMPLAFTPSRRNRQGSIPEGELYVHDILRIIDDHKMKELERIVALSPNEDDPDSPMILTEEQRHRFYRRFAVGFVAVMASLAYGTGFLPM